MGKIVLLVIREEMLHQAHNILQDKKFRIQEMSVIRTENAVMEARKSIADGASIIIARGLQASLIKQYTNIPVVEIVLTAQEMALLVTRAKQIAGRPRPVIAVVGIKNMFCDMSYFDELYDIELHTYYAGQGNMLAETALRAVEDHVDVIIGGDTAVAVATEAGVPSLFLSATEDSMRQAFSMAESMEYAMNVEKKTAAQIETLLDYSFSGVIRLDGDGMVAAVNPLMEDMIGRSQAELKGHTIREIAPMLGDEDLRQVFEDGKDCSLFLEWNHIQVYAVMAPVVIEGRVDGAIITCHKTKKKTAVHEEKRSERHTRGLPALTRFEDILQESKMMQECVRTASFYAMSDHPVVLRGEPGTEKRMLAESIHNRSSRGNGPFLDIPCEGLSGEEQRCFIFGEKGAALQAQGGTLLLRNVEELTAANQDRLYQLIRFHVCHGADIASMRKINVRIMAMVRQPLNQLVAQGKISHDLYYLLSGLELAVPPLRERREDLQKKIEITWRECCERYSHYHVMTNGAKAVLLNYPWKGNLFQIESFCERLILTAGKRSIDETAVKKLLWELYLDDADAAAGQEADEENVRSMLHIGHDSYENAKKIVETLRKHEGNREKTAKELGISKATLWRHMKKYGIES